MRSRTQIILRWKMPQFLILYPTSSPQTARCSIHGGVGSMFEAIKRFPGQTLNECDHIQAITIEFSHERIHLMMISAHLSGSRAAGQTLDIVELCAATLLCVKIAFSTKWARSSVKLFCHIRVTLFFASCPVPESR